MINRLLARLVRAVLWLRYRVRITGLEGVRQKGRSSILFLPNHPALIEPIILAAHLYGPFRVRALADETQVDRFLIRYLARRINVLTIPDLGHGGAQSAERVRAVIDQCVKALKQGDNLILYPAGRIYRQNREQIGANSAVERIVQAMPNVRIVLARTQGLWGSGFSWASGCRPLVTPVLRKGLKALLLNGIFFTPRRTVDIELAEPKNLPRQAGRKAINTYLEGFYNQTVERNTYVPYTLWEHGSARICPEPQALCLKDSELQISAVVRQQVVRQLQNMTGVAAIADEMSLARDLAMDSLALVELITWLESEYGHPHLEVTSLQSVGDVLLAASGAAVSVGERTLRKIPSIWFRTSLDPCRPDQLRDMTITAAFLHQARRQPTKVAVADSVSGVMTYRDMIVAIMLLKRQIAQMEGPYVGIMLPACVAVCLVYLAALFAGKTPVMVNWTLGRRHLQHALDSLNVGHIVTANALLAQISSRGVDLSDLSERFIPLEKLRARISKGEKLRAFVKAHLHWSELSQTQPPETAAILFTSGSENTPKAVPLSHRNLLTNVSDAYECFTLSGTDSFLGILPPFHSFGLTVCMILPLSLGARVAFYPNPTHGGSLAEIIEAYKLTILLGTPTFLNGILRTARPEQLHSLRLVVSGAEKCLERVYDLLGEMCPQTTVMEGYGVTECSPIISVNREENPQRGTIGKVMPSLEYAVVDPESGVRLPVGREGMLLVRGDSVFGGYLHHDGPSPFVEYEGKQWYRTGDLVVEDAEGTLTFGGRLKRFIKVGGEMVSLPAIESVLEQHFALPDDDGPSMAVVATPTEGRPDVVLFCTREITRNSANQVICQAGLSGLHNIRQVKRIDSLPLLGTGKVDYRSLVARLLSELNAS